MHGRLIEVVGHRGNARHAPENTLVSFRQAIEAGADIVEMDVLPTRDGRIVVIHDNKLGRTTDGTGEVIDMSLEELKQLDAGSWKSHEFRGERVPTLEEAAGCCLGKARVALDLKADGMARGIAESLSRAGAEFSRIILGPWDDQQAADVQRYLPGIAMMRIGDQPDPASETLFETMKGKGYSGFWLNWPTVTSEFVQSARRHGMCVYVWTVNEPHEMLRAVQVGVQGVVTDDPGLLRCQLTRS
jgi:glycerophosphoryl diester phosphodiesterase